MNNSRPNSIESRDDIDGYGNHTMGGMDSRVRKPRQFFQCKTVQIEKSR